MNRIRETECARLNENVICYAWGILSQELRPAVEAHVAHCPSCNDLVSFVSQLIAVESKKRASQNAPTEHPDPSQIVALEADELKEEEAREVGLHLLDCKACRQAYLLIRGLSEEQFEERVLAQPMRRTADAR
jgi:predicted anti-sigma-YlaC factor YlaD